jgi:hypothetical protein
MATKVVGKKVYRNDVLFAEIEGWRPKNSRRGAASYRNSGYTITYATGEKVGGYAYFRDALLDARGKSIMSNLDDAIAAAHQTTS